MRLIFIILAAGALVFGQQSAAPTAPQGSTLRATANEVLVDVVVRDKKGRPVRGLQAADFEIKENGVPQRITGLREVVRTRRAAGDVLSGQSVPPASREPGQSSLDPTRQIRLVSLVFDRLGIYSRQLARHAALDMLKTDSGPNTFFAVFSIDQRLSALQQFTDDAAALRRAVEKATSGTPSDFASATSTLKRAADQTAGFEGAAGNVTSTGGGVDGGAMASEQMNRMVQDMLLMAENANREQQGRSSIFSLLAVVQQQYRFPGRKSVLFFAEGLQVPNSMYEQFHSVISAANRANVSVYSIDARGLEVTGDNGQAEAALAAAAKSSRSQWTKKSGESDAVTLDQVLALDRAQDSIRANAQNSLAELAESTGGFLMANSNDLRVGMKRIAEDMTTYYEITYSPADSNYDAKFRNIEVSITRPDTHIQARKGYFALPPVEGQIVYPHELPLLQAVAQRPLPHAIDYKAAFLRFKPELTQLQTVLVFDVPLKNITFATDKTANTYRTHVSLLVLLKDADGHVLKKYSRDVPFAGSLDKLEAFQQGHFIYTRPMILPLGRMTLETAVLDREGEKISAARSAYFARGAAPDLAISSLTFIRRVEQGAATPDLEDPLQFAGGKVTPLLIDTMKTGKSVVLPVYFIVYPNPGDTTSPSLTMEFLKDGQLVARATPELPAANGQGVIPYIAETAVESFTPGEYEVRVTVKQGTSAAQERSFIRIE